MNIGSLIVDPPVVNGSGAVDVASQYPDWSVPDPAVSKLGAYVTKSITLEPRAGNPQPWAETLGDDTLVNAVGLANPGIDVVVDAWAALPQRLGIPIIASIAGGTPDEFAELARRITGAGWAAALELNLSCPNVHGGLIAGDARAAADVVTAVRETTGLPLLAKLSPACGDIAAVVRAVEAAGADALTCCNTMPVRWSGPSGEPLLGAGHHGGMSGVGLHPIALRVVAEAAAVSNLPIIGLGGVDGAVAAQRMRNAGASIIGVGSAAVIDPGVIAQLTEVSA